MNFLNVKIFDKILRTEGAAVVEFALVLPVMLIIFLGTYQVATYVYAIDKVSLVASSTVNNIGNSNSTTPLTSCRLTTLLQAAYNMGIPFSFSQMNSTTKQYSYGTVIATAAADLSDNNGVRIQWQQKVGGGVSRIGTVGQTPTLPAGLTVTPGNTAIFVEIMFNMQPLVSGTWGMTLPQIYRMVVTQPRVGTLVTLAPC